MSKDDKKDYEVGRGKPPVSTRFKKGQSGNPAGRPPEHSAKRQARLTVETFRKTTMDIALSPVTILENGVETVVPTYVAVMKGLAQDAKKGDRKSRGLFLDRVENAVSLHEKDQLQLMDLWGRMTDRRFKARGNPGSFEQYEANLHYFMVKRTFRQAEGEDRWPYELDEPMNNEEWKVYMEGHRNAKEGYGDSLWPPAYKRILEERREEAMSSAERAQSYLGEFKHRKHMRKKEGLEKWPYLVEEPQSDSDWAAFEKHIQDKIAGIHPPAPWPTPGWGEQGPLTDEEFENLKSHLIKEWREEDPDYRLPNDEEWAEIRRKFDAETEALNENKK